MTRLLEIAPIIPHSDSYDDRDLGYDHGVTIVGVPVYHPNGDREKIWVPVDVRISPLLYYQPHDAAKINKPIVCISGFNLEGIRHNLEAEVAVCRNGGIYLATLHLKDSFALAPVACKTERPAKRLAAFASADISGCRIRLNEFEHDKSGLLSTLQQSGWNLGLFRRAHRAMQHMVNGKEALEIRVTSPEVAKDYAKALLEIPRTLRDTIVQTGLLGVAQHHQQLCLGRLKAESNSMGPLS